MPVKHANNNDLRRTEHLTVVVRIRPLLEDETEDDAVAFKLEEKMVLLADPVAFDPVDVLRAKRAHDKKYAFDWTFDGNSTQKEVYEKTTKNLVESVVEGYNGTVFAYGATGAGKTYTMVGNDEDPGIMVRALRDLFVEVDKDQGAFQVRMSYLEIYNEVIRDLLMPSLVHLELREDARGNHQVVGLSEAKIASSEQVMSLLTRGNRQRTQEATGANQTSSRSHALLIVRVRRTVSSADQPQLKEIRTGSLYMVDLAGSERAANTQNTGKRLVEGAHINKSLLALGNCINALAERHVRYVNFRDSKLTRLLKEPLTGNCQTVMVAHVSPDLRYYEETRNTLVYADRAKNITTKIRSNVTDVGYHMAQYQDIIRELRQEIQSLRDKIQDRVTDSESTASSFSADGTGGENRLSEVEMKTLKEQLIASFNMQMDVRRRMMQIDNTLLGQSIEFDKLNMILNEWETERAVTTMDKSENENLPEYLPEHVRQAWDDLQYMRAQQQRYIQMREDCQVDYQRCKETTHKVTESLPDKKASSQEQRELLHLLARVYELEVEKLELQASQLLRDHELRYRDLMLRRYDRQRQLCEDIITRQRQLIDAMSTDDTTKNGDARKELNELYRIYQQELQELVSGRDSVLMVTRTGSANGLRPLGSSGSMLELYNMKQASAPDMPLPPIQHNELDDENYLFTRRKNIPPSSNQPSNNGSSRRSDSGGDWTVRSHGSDSPKALPPLERTTVEMPPRLVNEVVGSNNNRLPNNKNTMSRNPSYSSTSSSGSNAPDKRPLFVSQPKSHPKDVEAWGRPTAAAPAKTDGFARSESVEPRRRPYDADRPTRRFGLLPSLRPVEVPSSKHYGRTTSSDSDMIQSYKQRRIRLPYQNQEIETRNRNGGIVEVKTRPRFDRNRGYRTMR